MTETIYAALTVMGLGLVSFFHPCPITTNISAITFICGVSRGTARTVTTALFYIAGNMVTYTVITFILSFGFLAVPDLANTIQRAMNLFLGPVLILVGMTIARLLPWQLNKPPSKILSHWLPVKNRFKGNALLLGIILAAAFCPATAAIFFGLFVPMAIRFHAPILFPVLFAVGSGVPIMVFALLISRGITSLERFDRKNRWIGHMPRIFGIIILLAGLLLTIAGFSQ